MDTMKPIGKRAVVLRTTPTHFRGKDAELFPCLHARAQLTHAPSCYDVRVYRHRVRLTFDMYYVPERIGFHQAALYRQYVDWWFNAHRKNRPKDGVGYSDCFRDFVAVTVLREHARWWIDLFDAAAPFIDHPFMLDYAERRIEAATAQIGEIIGLGQTRAGEWLREKKQVIEEETSSDSQQHERANGRTDYSL